MFPTIFTNGFWTTPGGNTIYVGETLGLSEIIAALIVDPFVPQIQEAVRGMS